MLILTLKTEQPEAECDLYDDQLQLTSLAWPAHRQLAETIHDKLGELLRSQKHELRNVQGIVVFHGPGSFTGLRIGISVANALAYSLQIPIVGSGGLDWQKSGIGELLTGKNEKIIVPEYGSPPHVTAPKH